MSVTQRNKIQIAVPEYAMDQIVQVLEGTFSAPGGNGSQIQTNFQFPAAPSVDYYASKTVFSLDGGNTWLMGGNQVINGTNPVTGLLTMSCSTADSYIDGLGGAGVGVTASNSTATTYNVLVRVILIARFDQDHVPLEKLIKKLRYQTNLNYMKIFIDGKVDLPSSGTTTVKHGLGYLPNCNFWLAQIDQTPGDPPEIDMFEAGGTGVGIDAQNIVITATSVGTFLRRLYYRIYLDG